MNDKEAMLAALDLAREAALAGDVPVGAVVLDADGRIIGRGYNTREAGGDPLAHAEIIAMREAAAMRRQRAVAIGDTTVPAGRTRADDAGAVSGSDRSWNLADCTLAVTLEPCPMCAGACIQTHIGRIVFGAWDAKLGACGSIWDIPRDPHVGHTPEVYGGVLERDCQTILTDFFTARR
ncbi:nucleoside deaminase [Bifidobacterium callitrichidarum]|uniref:tRNA-specific adenosine deaminase n=1 Tax=Bifidobacterium callitrichidarum TaxID=2052941 RepID=A0A2U2MXW3_9BIFI|nr:nucleoside deaminase [Bifidobacterium callitrichidarum]PWG61861.1 tRNA-specific adenosine deaminase [Bifidobacterium callitrichidarum]